MDISGDEMSTPPNFFCKTDFDMREIKKEEAGYVPLPRFYTFQSRDERERILYKIFFAGRAGCQRDDRGCTE